MAFKVNRDAINKAVEEAAAKQSSFRGDGPSVKWFQMKSNKAKLRVMPPWTDQGMYAGKYWRIVNQHWHISEDMKAPIMCPKTTPDLDGDCVICDFVAQLKESNDPATLELAKEIRDKQAYLFTVIDCSDAEYTVSDVADFKKKYPDKTVPFSAGDAKMQVYAAPFSVYNQIVNLDQTGFDLTDLEKGHNITITKTHKGGKSMNVTYTVMPDPRSSDSNVPDSHPLIDLTKVGIVFDKNKMLEVLNSGVGADFANVLPKGDAPNKALPSNTKKKVEVEEEEDEDLALSDSEEDLEEAMMRELND